MRIVLNEGEEVLHDARFESGPVIVGSSSSCGIHLPDLNVRLEHARLITVPGGKWMIEAITPNAAVMINGKPLEQRCPLHNGDDIRIGDFRIKVAVDGNYDLGTTGKTSLDQLARVKDFPLPKGGEAHNQDHAIQVDAAACRLVSRLALFLEEARSVEQLIDRTFKYLFKVFQPRMGWFAGRHHPRGPLEYMETRNADGSPGAHPPVWQSILEYRCLERGQSIRLRRTEDGASAIAAPLEGERGRFGIIYLESSKQADRFPSAKLDLLTALAAQIGAHLEAVLLPRGKPVVAAAAPLVPSDGSMVRSVQSNLLPTSVPPWPGYEFGAYTRPGAGHGSDIYDVLTMPNGMATVMLASAAADALQTALAITEAFAAFRVASLHADPPRTLLREMNWLLCSRGKCALSLVHLVMNPKTGAMEICTAGPIGAMIINESTGARNLTDPNQAPIGLTRAVEFPRRTAQLAAGEMLVLFSPGCRTLLNAASQPLGENRLRDSFAESIGLSPAKVLAEVQGELADFFKRGSQPDDITLIVVQRS